MGTDETRMGGLVLAQLLNELKLLADLKGFTTEDTGDTEILNKNAFALKESAFISVNQRSKVCGLRSLCEITTAFGHASWSSGHRLFLCASTWLE